MGKCLAPFALQAAKAKFPCEESIELHLNADGNESVIVFNLLQNVFKMGRPGLFAAENKSQHSPVKIFF